MVLYYIIIGLLCAATAVFAFVKCLFPKFVITHNIEYLPTEFSSEYLVTSYITIRCDELDMEKSFAICGYDGGTLIENNKTRCMKEVENMKAEIKKKYPFCKFEVIEE